jgi:hypothetical protein
MPLIRQLRPDGVYETHCSGVTDVETVIQSIREIPDLIGPEREWYEIAIHEPDSIRSTNYEENQMVRMEAVKALSLVKHGAVALVGLSVVNFGSLRQLSLIMNNEPVPIAAFDNVDEAESWIAAQKETGPT